MNLNDLIKKNDFDLYISEYNPKIIISIVKMIFGKKDFTNDKEKK